MFVHPSLHVYTYLHSSVQVEFRFADLLFLYTILKIEHKYTFIFFFFNFIVGKGLLLSF